MWPAFPVGYSLLLMAFGTFSADHPENVSGGEVSADRVQERTSRKSSGVMVLIDVACALRLDYGSDMVEAPGGEELTVWTSDGFACAGEPFLE